MLRTSHSQRQPDHQNVRFPFAEERRDFIHARRIAFGADSSERMRHADARNADGDAGEFFAKIERKYGAVERNMVDTQWPLSAHVKFNAAHSAAACARSSRMTGVLG